MPASRPRTPPFPVSICQANQIETSKFSNRADYRIRVQLIARLRSSFAASVVSVAQKALQSSVAGCFAAQVRSDSQRIILHVLPRSTYLRYDDAHPQIAGARDNVVCGASR